MPLNRLRTKRFVAAFLASTIFVTGASIGVASAATQTARVNQCDTDPRNNAAIPARATATSSSINSTTNRLDKLVLGTTERTTSYKYVVRSQKGQKQHGPVVTVNASSHKVNAQNQIVVRPSTAYPKAGNPYVKVWVYVGKSKVGGDPSCFIYVKNLK